MQLLDLPDELLDICCFHIEERPQPADKYAYPTAEQNNLEAFRNVRLTCKRISHLATKHLFAQLIVLPTKDSALKARAVLDNARLNPLVKTMRLSASLDDSKLRDEDLEISWSVHDEDDPEWETDPDTEEHAIDVDGEVSATFKRMMADIGRFCNLRRVELHFDYVVEGPSTAAEDYRRAFDLIETVEYREIFLRKFLSALNHPDHPATKLNSLSIYNLQDYSNGAIAKSDDFKALLSRLDELELFIVSEDDEASDRQIEIIERHDFYAKQLRQYWLQPLHDIGRLTTLKLYGSISWGYLPKCDLRGLHFPKLKTLVLGHMTFTHEWQLEWILSHSTSLESLKLHNCPIIPEIELACAADAEGYANPDYRSQGTSRGRRVASTWKYDSRWHHYFDSFRTRLPRLRNFAVTHDAWYQCSGGPDCAGRAFLAPESWAAEVHISRYCSMSG